MKKRRPGFRPMKRRFRPQTRVEPLASMSPATFFETRETFNLSQKEIAEFLGVTTRTVNRWEQGITPIPPMVDGALSVLIQEIEEKEASKDD